MFSLDHEKSIFSSEIKSKWRQNFARAGVYIEVLSLAGVSTVPCKKEALSISTCPASYNYKSTLPTLIIDQHIVDAFKSVLSSLQFQIWFSYYFFLNFNTTAVMFKCFRGFDLYKDIKYISSVSTKRSLVLSVCSDTPGENLDLINFQSKFSFFSFGLHTFGVIWHTKACLL